MRVNRRFLYIGVFLIALGAVLVADDFYGFDARAVEDALRLWPLIIIALGLVLLLRRTRLSLAGGVLAAALPGLALGGMIAVGPTIDFGCGPNSSGEPASFQTQDGTFSGPASVNVTLRCGDITVATASGPDWSLQSGNTEGHAANVTSSGTGLTIQSPSDRSFGFRVGRDVWRLTVPTANPIDLSLHVNAGEGTVHLANAQLRSVSIATDAGATRADLTGATLQTLETRVNAGSSRVQLPDTSFTGTISVNAGELRMCAPADLGVRVHSNVTMGSATYRGLAEQAGGWETGNYATATNKADLTITVNLGSVTLNPVGGC